MPQAAVKRPEPTWDTTVKPEDGPGHAEPRESVAPQSRGVPADARGLQASLQRRLMAKSPSASRWSTRRTFAFVVTSSLVLWGLIIWGGLEVVSRLAG